MALQRTRKSVRRGSRKAVGGRKSKRSGGAFVSSGKCPPKPVQLAKGTYGGAAVFAKTRYNFPKPAKVLTEANPTTYQWWSDDSEPPSESGSSSLLKRAFNQVTNTAGLALRSAQDTVCDTLRRANFLQSLGYKVVDISSVTSSLTPSKHGSGTGSDAMTCTYYAILYRKYRPIEREQLKARDTRRELCAWLWTSRIVENHHKMGKRENAFCDMNRSKIRYLGTTWNNERNVSNRFFDNLFGMPYNTDTLYSTVWFFA